MTDVRIRNRLEAIRVQLGRLGDCSTVYSREKTLRHVVELLDSARELVAKGYELLLAETLPNSGSK